MIEVEMTDDIRKYETKTVGPFTTRQVISIVIGAAYSIPIGLLIPVSMDNKIFIMIMLAVPAFLCGFIKMDGMPFEALAARMLYMYVLTPTHRKYDTPCSFRKDMEAREKRILKRNLARLTPEQRKIYEKKHDPKNRVIRYSEKAKYKVYT